MPFTLAARLKGVPSGLPDPPDPGAKLSCGLMMLPERMPVCFELPLATVTPGSELRPSGVVPDGAAVDVTAVVLPLPLPAEMFPIVELLLELRPPRLSCGLMMLPERKSIWVVLPLETVVPVVPEPVPVDVTVVVLPLPLRVEMFPIVELLLEFWPNKLSCGLMMLPERMSI